MNARRSLLVVVSLALLGGGAFVLYQRHGQADPSDPVPDLNEPPLGRGQGAGNRPSSPASRFA